MSTSEKVPLVTPNLLISVCRARPLVTAAVTAVTAIDHWSWVVDLGFAARTDKESERKERVTEAMNVFSAGWVIAEMLVRLVEPFRRDIACPSTTGVEEEKYEGSSRGRRVGISKTSLVVVRGAWWGDNRCQALLQLGQVTVGSPRWGEGQF
ncbi:hypothetical protein PAXINDRAFT_179068 [Paxillus involutus ATCC 200175]|nr:hypothetical protein PAXINDRAFT_179068 [Paxillus involutus ATCC 200175]